MDEKKWNMMLFDVSIYAYARAIMPILRSMIKNDKKPLIRISRVMGIPEYWDLTLSERIDLRMGEIMREKYERFFIYALRHVDHNMIIYYYRLITTLSTLNYNEKQYEAFIPDKDLKMNTIRALIAGEVYEMFKDVYYGDKELKRLHDACMKMLVSDGGDAKSRRKSFTLYEQFERRKGRRDSI